MIEHPRPSLIDLVSLAGGAVDGHVVTTLEAAGFPGLRTRHGYVVQRLLAGERTVTGIARSLGVTQQAMSKTIGELERLGYVQRDADPADARRRSLSLSARGVDAVETARRARAEVLAKVTAEVGETRTRDAEAVLRSILGALGLAAHIDDRSVPVPTGSDVEADGQDDSSSSAAASAPGSTHRTPS